KQRGKGVYYGKKQKQVVVGLRQRKGTLRFIHTKDAKANTLKAIIEEHIGEEVQYIMTDESSASWGALLNNPKHKVIRHNIGKYVEGIVHTNSIESAFSYVVARSEEHTSELQSRFDLVCRLLLEKKKKKKKSKNNIN